MQVIESGLLDPESSLLIRLCVFFSPRISSLSNNRSFSQSNNKQEPDGDKLHGYGQKIIKFVEKEKELSGWLLFD